METEPKSQVVFYVFSASGNKKSPQKYIMVLKI